MYKVYKDPEGKRYLEEPSSHHNSTIKTTVSNENEETYKKRLESLNEEMKVLNDELEMVSLYKAIELMHEAWHFCTHFGFVNCLNLLYLIVT